MEKILGQKVFSADQEQLNSIIEYVKIQAADNPLSEQARFRVQLAVEEAAANIIQYAYKECCGKIIVRVLRKNHQFVVEFIDYGIPYNPLLKEAPDCTSTLEEREVGGLGIFFICQFVDDVYYQRKDNQNILGLIMNLEQEGMYLGKCPSLRL